ncbi:MAG: CinA family protein [Pseudobdellovibrionaceae bacterium]
MNVCSQNLQSAIEKLRSRKQTVGFGESCTGGLLAATLAALPGVSDIFLGSVVSYSNQAKVDLLGVSWSVLKVEGAVSGTVARQMAQGVRNQLKCHWSVTITGIAGPTGGTEFKPVGTVWFAVIGPGFDTTERKLFSGSRTEIQKQAVDFAIELLLKSMG